MAEPTYRITTEHDPTETIAFARWQARIVRLSDGEAVSTIFANSEDAVIVKASDHIASMASGQAQGHVYFACEDGAILDGDPRDTVSA